MGGINMAKIIYKEGQEGQNRLDCIEGIEIELLNGQKALIYPKYAERALLPNEQISDWTAPVETEIEALKSEDNTYKTKQLFGLNSSAAMWVYQFWSDKYGIFYLPSLLAAMGIQRQKENIDTLAETIEGVDLLRDFTNITWSCSRFSLDAGWVLLGNISFASFGYLYSSYLAVPTVLYR